jgi:hypothetical protein
MPLPTIPALKPISVDAQPAVAFNEAFLTKLEFQAPSPTDKWTLFMSCRNFNASTGQLGPAETGHSTKIYDVAVYSTRFSVFAQCLATNLVVAGLVQTQQSAELALMDAQALPADDATRQSKIDAANAALASANAALGG